MPTTKQKQSQPALRVVNEDEQRGDLGLTQETMANWRQGQRICRSRKRHNWGPYTVYEHRARAGATRYEVVEQCSHCRNRRWADFVQTAYGLRKEGKWHPDYRDGYLLPHGAARIDDDMHDILVAQDILSRRMVEVLEDDEEKTK